MNIKFCSSFWKGQSTCEDQSHIIFLYIGIHLRTSLKKTSLSLKDCKVHLRYLFKFRKVFNILGRKNCIVFKKISEENWKKMLQNSVEKKNHLWFNKPNELIHFMLNICGDNLQFVLSFATTLKGIRLFLWKTVELEVSTSWQIKGKKHQTKKKKPRITSFLVLGYFHMIQKALNSPLLNSTNIK